MNYTIVDLFKSRSTEYQNYLVNRGYEFTRVREQLENLESTSRETPLYTKPKHYKRVFSLVMDHNPRLTYIGKLIEKHLPLICASEELSKFFPECSIFPAYRRSKNLKEMVNTKSKAATMLTTNVTGRSNAMGDVLLVQTCKKAIHFPVLRLTGNI